jgi:hypothetical protein
MARITWKKNKIISIETRPGNFVLAQMLQSLTLAIFNLFRSDENWMGTIPSKENVLFYTHVTRQFLQCSNITLQKLEPVLNISSPNRWIGNDGHGRKVKIFEDTAYEKDILTIGERGKLIEQNFDKDGRYIGERVLIPSISLDDNIVIDSYELSSIHIYAEFNERLYLCGKYKKNVDPMKDILFNRPIPLEYKTYIDIISDSITKEEWLQLKEE